MKTDQYLRTYKDAFEILRHHVPDQKPGKEKHKTDKDRPSNPSGGNKNTTTLATGEESSFAQSGTETDIYCYICGKKGHVNKDCPKKHLPRSQWVLQQLLANRQHHTQRSVPDDEESEDK